MNNYWFDIFFKLILKLRGLSESNKRYTLINLRYTFLCITPILLIKASTVIGQNLDVTFRYIKKPNEEFVRIFVPGTMPSGSANDWGPNSNGTINPSAPSIMNFIDNTDSYQRTYSLDVGSQYLYKFHFHYDESGINNSWIPDPLNPETTNDGYDNSILNIVDPLFFQPARHLNNEGTVDGLSLGIASNGNVEYISYSIGEDNFLTEDYIYENNVFYASIDPPRSLFESYKIEVTIDGQSHVAYDQSSLEIIEQEMPENIDLGPTWIDGTMYVAIYAPSQPVLQMIITAPGETGLASDAIILKKDPTRIDTWWTSLSLPVGQYDYEYLLLNGNRMPDPFSRRIANGKTRIEIGPGGVTTADDYQWETTDYVRPSLDTLIIYELHVDDFSSKGNGQGGFQDIIDKLDYLKLLGINAIELMPITEFPGTHSWGYDPQVMSALESNYGTPEDFKKLIDEAHSRGIAIILDLVWNHIRSTSPIWTVQPDYNLNPYIKHYEEMNPNEAPESWGMLDLDHFNSKTIDYINKVNRIWVDEYRVDGFRFDAAAHLGWDNQQPEYGLLSWTSTLYDYDSTIYQIAEHLPANIELIENSDLSSGWHDSFHDIIKNDIHHNNNSATDFMRQVVELHEYNNWGGNPYDDRTQAVKFMISHDEQSVIQEMVNFNNFTIDQARERDQFYATVLFTSLGIPMLWQGQEFGFKSGWTDSNGNGNWDEEKLSYRPVDWEELETAEGQEHFQFYKKLIALRKSNPAFSEGTFFDLYRYENQRVIVYGYQDERPEGNNDQVVVIANFSSNDHNIVDVPFISAGYWYNAINPNDTLYTGDGNYGEYTISAKNAAIYINNNVQLSNDAPETIVYPENFLLFKAYPNPFNSRITFFVKSKNDFLGEIKIFDVAGKIVFMRKSLEIKSGENHYYWNGLDMKGMSSPSGLYFVVLNNGTQIFNQKILMIK